MLVYEVNITIDSNIYDEYIEWIFPHAQKVASHEGFIKVDIFETQDEDKNTVFVSHYWIQSQDHLDNYLTDYAPQLRQEAEEKFGPKIKGFRRILRHMV